MKSTSLNQYGCFRAWIAAGAVAVCLPFNAAAQESVQLFHEATFPEPFAYVGGIRTLSDGRLMVADPLGQALAVINLEDGHADTLGRVGAGPQEYQQPDAVFPLPSDSTLLTDLGNGRLTVITPNGAFGETNPIPRELAGGRLTIVMPRFVDASGNIYYQPESFTAGGPADSAAIVRLNRSANRIDTLGIVMLSPSNESRAGSMMRMRRGPLRPRDDWAVGSDGRVAIIRGTDYSVEWILPDGQVTRGPSNEYDRVDVGRGEKEEWIADMALDNINVGMMMSPEGERSMGFSRGGGGGPPNDIDAYDWPREMPPFRNKRSRVTPEGDLWVERYTRAESPPTIDVFDRLGQKKGSLVLPAGRRVMGFGDGVALLVHTDEDGLQWVERYRIEGSG